MVLEKVEESYKGQFCSSLENLFCQEGYCSECAISKKMIIYISGPYSLGDVAENVRNACLAGNQILAKGHIPFVPHLTHLWHLITPKAQQEWLDIDLALIPRMDALLRLQGESKGADDEVALAKSLGIRVYYSLQEIRESVG